MVGVDEDLRFVVLNALEGIRGNDLEDREETDAAIAKVGLGVLRSVEVVVEHLVGALEELTADEGGVTFGRSGVELGFEIEHMLFRFCRGVRHPLCTWGVVARIGAGRNHEGARGVGFEDSTYTDRGVLEVVLRLELGLGAEERGEKGHLLMLL